MSWRDGARIAGFLISASVARPIANAVAVSTLGTRTAAVSVSADAAAGAGARRVAMAKPRGERGLENAMRAQRLASLSECQKRMG